MKGLRHRVKVIVKDHSGNDQHIITGTTMRLPERLLRLLFGKMSEIMIITPGGSVEGIEITEIGGVRDEKDI